MVSYTVCQQIAEIVERLRSRRHRRENLADYYARVLAPNLPQIRGIDPITLGTIGIMAYLGPGGCPPEPLWRACSQFVCNFVAQLSRQAQCEKLVQIVLAYGCMWGRYSPNGNNAWDIPWARAYQELTVTAENFILAIITGCNKPSMPFAPLLEMSNENMLCLSSPSS